MTRILVVEDDRDIRHATERGLRLRGVYDVEMAENGREALDRLAMEPLIDLIISDFNMPLMDGEELYRQVETLYPHLAKRFVFYCGSACPVPGVPFLMKGGFDPIGDLSHIIHSLTGES